MDTTAEAFELPSAARRHEVFVSWDASWPVEAYVDWYLRSRGLPCTAIWCDAARGMLEVAQAEGAAWKSDLDYFLDLNAERWHPALVT
jgi:hypothetical protein